MGRSHTNGGRVGRELGTDGIHAFCEDKTISFPAGVEIPVGD